MNEVIIEKNRNKIYKEMLAYVNNIVEPINQYGYSLCSAMYHNDTLCKIIANGMPSYPLMQHLPELIKHKPTSFYDYMGVETTEDYQFWFNTGNKEARVLILEQAIKETEWEAPRKSLD